MNYCICYSRGHCEDADLQVLTSSVCLSVINFTFPITIRFPMILQGSPLLNKVNQGYVLVISWLPMVKQGYLLVTPG